MVYKVSKEFLDSLLKFQMKVLMGQSLKRVEEIGKIELKSLSEEEQQKVIAHYKEVLLAELRELLPEWCRSLKYNIASFSSGLQSFKFDFKRPHQKDNSE